MNGGNGNDPVKQLAARVKSLEQQLANLPARFPVPPPSVRMELFAVSHFDGLGGGKYFATRLSGICTATADSADLSMPEGLSNPHEVPDVLLLNLAENATSAHGLAKGQIVAAFVVRGTVTLQGATLQIAVMPLATLIPAALDKYMVLQVLDDDGSVGWDYPRFA